MTPTSYSIQECTDQGCRFRFPLGNDLDLKGRCPRCGAATRSAVTPPALQDENTRTPQTARQSSQASLFTIEALLDNIRSAWNVGSMFRTADGAGIRHLHLTGFTPTPEHPKVAPTALGAEKRIPWTYSPNSLDSALSLKAQGWTLWALEDISGGSGLQPESIFNFKCPPGGLRALLIVGNEVFGVDPGLLALCERVLYIPMLGQKRSLNVAVAFGIAAYALRFVEDDITRIPRLIYFANKFTPER